MGSALYAQYARGYNPLAQMQGIIDFQRGQTALSQERFNLQQAQLQPAYAGLNALLENPNANWNDVNAALANSARLGGDTTGLVANASDFAAQGGNPADFIRQYGTARYVPPFEAANLFLPQYAEQRTGMGTYPGQVSGPATPGGPQWSPSGFVARGVSPEQWAQPVPYAYNPQTGGTLYQPWGTRYGGTPGMGGMVGTGGGPAGGMGAGGPNIPGAGGPAMLKQEALMNVMLRESGGQDIMNAQGSGAGGYFQMMPETWQEGKQLAGIPADAYPQAQGTPLPVQYAVASALYDRYGTAPWAASAQNAGRFPGADAAMMAAQGPTNAAYYPPMPGMGGTGGVGPGGALPPGYQSIYGPGLTTAPPAPGMTEAAQEAAKGAAGRQQQLAGQANASVNIRPILAGMETEINTPGFLSGAGNYSVGTLRQILSWSGIAPQNMDVRQGQAANEAFNKFASQLQQQQMASLGGMGSITDDRQALAQASNPSLLNSVGGNLAVLHVLEGNQQAIDLMDRTFAGSGKSPAQFDTWRRQFTAKDPTTGGRFDPRVFWLANMTPQEQFSYQQATKQNPRAWTELTRNLDYALHQGWISQNADRTVGTTD